MRWGYVIVEDAFERGFPARFFEAIWDRDPEFRRRWRESLSCLSEGELDRYAVEVPGRCLH